MKFLTDFTNLPYSNKHYGGNAGFKRGVIINDKNWLLKFPQETSTFDNVTISFTTSPLSEADEFNITTKSCIVKHFVVMTQIII